MDFVLKRRHQVVFDSTQAFSFILRYNKDEKSRPKSVPSKKIFNTLNWRCATFFEISSYSFSIFKIHSSRKGHAFFLFSEMLKDFIVKTNISNYDTVF